MANTPHRRIIGDPQKTHATVPQDADLSTELPLYDHQDDFLFRTPLVCVFGVFSGVSEYFVKDGAGAIRYLGQTHELLATLSEQDGSYWPARVADVIANATKYCGTCGKKRKLIQFDTLPRTHQHRYWTSQDGRKSTCMECDKDVRAITLKQANKRRELNLLYAEGSHTVEEWLSLVAKYENRCLCCKNVFETALLTKDHVKPVSCLGANSIDNLQPLCRRCNSRKGTREVDYRPDFVVAVVA